MVVVDSGCLVVDDACWCDTAHSVACPCIQSADYDPHHPGTVRRDGSYIYEEFLTTGGTDVKVYTVGPRCVISPVHVRSNYRRQLLLVVLVPSDQQLATCGCSSLMQPRTLGPWWLSMVLSRWSNTLHNHTAQVRTR